VTKEQNEVFEVYRKAIERVDESRDLAKSIDERVIAAEFEELSREMKALRKRMYLRWDKSRKS
jgi:hypothetical protein